MFLHVNHFDGPEYQCGECDEVYEHDADGIAAEDITK